LAGSYLHKKCLQPNYITCSLVINYCDRNVYFTEMSRTEGGDEFFRHFRKICSKPKVVCHAVTLQGIL